MYMLVHFPNKFILEIYVLESSFPLLANLTTFGPIRYTKMQACYNSTAFFSSASRSWLAWVAFPSLPPPSTVLHMQSICNLVLCIITWHKGCAAITVEFLMQTVWSVLAWDSSVNEPVRCPHSLTLNNYTYTIWSVLCMTAVCAWELIYERNYMHNYSLF